jgi:acyl-CoA thioesterase-1
MVNTPSGLLTCFVRFSALSTLSRFIRTWALAILLLLIAGQNAVPAPAPAILVLGDSLSAAYGIDPAQGWVALLDKRLKAQGYGYRVVNASVSGETSTGGLQRLPRALKLHKPGIVILELGANDGLRGLPVGTTRANLQKIVAGAHSSGAHVLLLGMRIPPNYGERYTREFEKIFADLGAQKRTTLVPFFLESVAMEPRLMQDDGLHPNALGQPALLDAVWPALATLLQAR